MAVVDNSSSHSLSPKVPKFILTARESLVFQLLLSISAPSRSVTDYLGHRIWISSLTTSPSWQSRLQPSRGTGHWSVTRCHLSRKMSLSTECAAALLSFRHPSILCLKQSRRSTGYLSVAYLICQLTCQSERPLCQMRRQWTSHMLRWPYTKHRWWKNTSDLLLHNPTMQMEIKLHHPLQIAQK